MLYPGTGYKLLRRGVYLYFNKDAASVKEEAEEPGEQEVGAAEGYSHPCLWEDKA